MEERERRKKNLKIKKWAKKWNGKDEVKDEKRKKKNRGIERTGREERRRNRTEKVPPFLFLSFFFRSLQIFFSLPKEFKKFFPRSTKGRSNRRKKVSFFFLTCEVFFFLLLLFSLFLLLSLSLSFLSFFLSFSKIFPLFRNFWFGYPLNRTRFLISLYSILVFHSRSFSIQDSSNFSILVNHLSFLFSPQIFFIFLPLFPFLKVPYSSIQTQNLFNSCWKSHRKFQEKSDSRKILGTYQRMSRRTTEKIVGWKSIIFPTFPKNFPSYSQIISENAHTPE